MSDTDGPRRLYRSESDRMIGGVSGGLGEFFGVDPTLVRIAFLVLAFMGGAGIPIYVAMWIIVPNASRVGVTGRDSATDAATEMRDVVQRGADQAKSAYDRWRTDRGSDRGTTGGAPSTPPPPAPGSPGAPTTPWEPTETPDTSAGADAPSDTTSEER